MLRTTDYVVGREDVSGDPSPFTAIGVFDGIRAVAQFMNGSDSLDGMKIAVQGLGKVGMDLAKQLHAAGEALKARGILYAPDFIINGGGVINAGQEAFTTYDKENVMKQVHNIYNTVYRMLEESKATGKPEGVIATEFAENRIRNGLDA